MGCWGPSVQTQVFWIQCLFDTRQGDSSQFHHIKNIHQFFMKTHTQTKRTHTKNTHTHIETTCRKTHKWMETIRPTSPSNSRWRCYAKRWWVQSVVLSSIPWQHQIQFSQEGKKKHTASTRSKAIQTINIYIYICKWITIYYWKKGIYMYNMHNISYNQINKPLDQIYHLDDSLNKNPSHSVNICRHQLDSSISRLIGQLLKTSWSW